MLKITRSLEKSISKKLRVDNNKIVGFGVNGSENSLN